LNRRIKDATRTSQAGAAQATTGRAQPGDALTSRAEAGIHPVAELELELSRSIGFS
jgi:hypothetical protein